MKRSRFSEEQIIGILNEHQAGVGAKELCRKHGISDTAAYKAIAPKLGCSPDSLRVWCQQAERKTGQRAGLTSAEKDRIKELEREVRELRQANEILKKASAYFAAVELVLCKSWFRGKREPLPSTTNCGAVAGVALCGAWSLRTAVEFEDPRLFLGPERIHGLWARTTSIGEQKNNQRYHWN